MKKLRSTLLLALLILLASTITAHASNLNPDKQLCLPQKFRILAVEALGSGGVQWQSGQYLIRKLMQFSNWNNSTQQYVSYIHLLSRYTRQQCISEARPFWTGNSTKTNVHTEIIDFLGAASSDELVIFYCMTEGIPLNLLLDETITAAELTIWLGTLRGTVCVIFDSCYSGSWIDDGQGGVLGPGRIVLCSSRSDQLSWGGNVPYWGGDFRGYESVYYAANKTYIPVGLIGGARATLCRRAHTHTHTNYKAAIEDFSESFILWNRLFRVMRKGGIVEENCFWNNAHTASLKHVSIGIQHSVGKNGS